MTTDQNKFEFQVEYFKNQIARCNSWNRALCNELLHLFPKDLITIVDDYSNAYFQTKSWYIQMCQDFLKNEPLSENYHSVRSFYDLAEMICKPKLTPEEQVEIIWVSHQLYNSTLLKGTIHPGCSDSDGYVGRHDRLW